MKRWYRIPVVKAIFILLAIVMTAVLGVCSVILLGMHGGANTIVTEKKYVESQSFGNVMSGSARSILNEIEYAKKFEKNDVYNEDQIVDVMEYANSGKISGKNDSGIAYTLGDLKKWNKSIGRYGLKYDEAKRIIVCQKPDQSYYYYYEDELKNQIKEGKLRVIIDGAELRTDFSENANEKIREFYEYLKSYTEMSNVYTDFRIENEKKETLYTDCWAAVGVNFYEVTAPVGYKNIVEALNANPSLNGKMELVFEELSEVLSNIGYELSTYEEYEKNQDYWTEGNTNLIYLMVDQEQKKVYTNREAFGKYEDAEKNIESIVNTPDYKYVVVREKLADFESNVKHADAERWRTFVQSEGIFSKDSIFVVAVDTRFPIKDNYYKYKQIYDTYSPYLEMAEVGAVVSLILILTALVILTVGAGKRTEDEDIHLNWFDRWKTELGAAAVIILWMLWTGLAGLCWSGIGYQEIDYGVLHYEYNYVFAMSYRDVIVIVGYSIGTMALFLTGYLSLVRRIKGQNIWKNSILRMVLRGCGRILRAIGCGFRNLWRYRSLTTRTILLFIGFVFIHFLMVIAPNGFFLFLMLGVDVAAAYYLVRGAIGKDKIRKGIEKIASGDMEYQIPLDGLQGEYRQMAEEINDIANGLNRAVEERTKSERLKTDLITNVSHDIKTPLTSIINYVDLLKRENIDDPKIQGYLDVLEAKSQRLKTLTEDVVEASKISSGNINLEMMDVNLVEMLNQTVGEFAEKMAANELEVITTFPEEPVIIHVDGRRMWRVLENIFNNAAKYAMPGTRIYVDLHADEEQVELTMKNISAQKLNIKAEELTERFIRGDISRSTEGSGLGLSIAKTLTEKQGGSFDLYLDGDFFKVMIKFDRIKR